MRVRGLLPLVFACSLASTVPAQQPTATPPPASAAADIDVRMIRL